MTRHTVRVLLSLSYYIAAAGLGLYLPPKYLHKPHMYFKYNGFLITKKNLKCHFTKIANNIFFLKNDKGHDLSILNGTVATKAGSSGIYSQLIIQINQDIFLERDDAADVLFNAVISTN